MDNLAPALQLMKTDPPKHPKHKLIDPYSLPKRPRGMDMVRWLQTEAPKADREYCKALVVWGRRNKAHVFPGLARLMGAIG